MKQSLSRLLKQIMVGLQNKTAALTLYEKLSLIISLLGALSLIFIYFQTRLIYTQSAQTTTSMQASMYATIAAQTLEMNKVFIEHPELRPYFYNKRDIKEDENNYNRVLAIAEQQLDYFDATMTQLTYIPDEQDKVEDRQTWRSYFARSFAMSPILCKRINANRDWYMRTLTEIADENCK